MRVSAAIGVGVLAVFGASTAYANWKWQQGVCVRYYPDGSEKVLYGKDCDLPSAPTAGEAMRAIAVFFDPFPSCSLGCFGCVENSPLSEHSAFSTEYPELPTVTIGIEDQQCANRRAKDKVDFCG